MRGASSPEIGAEACARASFQAGLLGERESDQALRALEDRNLIVHAYKETLALELLERVPSHLGALALWVNELRKRA